MLNDYNQLLAEIGQAAVAGAPEGWTALTIEVVGLADSVTVDAYAAAPGGEVEIGWPTSGSIAAFKLREAMCQESTGTWYRATFTVDDQGQMVTDFDYDAKPFESEEEGDPDVVDLLRKDHELYPRDNGHLPGWHPARQ